MLGNLDADNFTVVAHAELPEAELTQRFFALREDKQAEAGLSQTRRPALCASSLISCLVNPASSRGAATWCWRAAI